MDNNKKFHLKEKNQRSEKTIDHPTKDVIQFLKLFKLIGRKLRDRINDKAKD